MDSNLMSCPTCGHAVSSTAGVCAYCGAMISERVDKDQADANLSAEQTPSAVSEPPVQPAKTSQDNEITKESDDMPITADEPSESILSPQTPVEPIAADSAESATEAESSTQESTADAEIELEAALPEEDQVTLPDPAGVRQSGDSASTPESVSNEPSEPTAVSAYEPLPVENLLQEDEVLLGAKDSSAGNVHQTTTGQDQAGSDTEKMPMPAAPEVLDLVAEEPDESETLGAEIIEMVETLSAEAQGQKSIASDNRSSPAKGAGARPGDHADDRLPTEAEEAAAENKDALSSESLGDTILLEPANEVQPPAKADSEKSQEKTKMGSPKETRTAIAGSGAKAADPKIRPEMLKIEKAAQEMAAAIKKQKNNLVEVENTKNKKADIAKAQALKKQKVALAKEQAKKKQKLLLAKAAALKRKKAAEAKAQALKKQGQAPAGIEAPKKEKAAAVQPRQEGKPTAVARNPEINSRMQVLLNKYEGQAIGINYDNSTEIKEALLETANSEYFSVFVKDKQLHYNYPLKTILTVIEGQDGVDIGNTKQPNKFNAVIKVYPLVLF